MYFIHIIIISVCVLPAPMKNEYVIHVSLSFVVFLLIVNPDNDESEVQKYDIQNLWTETSTTHGNIWTLALKL